MKLILMIALITVSFSVNAQVFDLVRSIVTSNSDNSFIRLKDTAAIESTLRGFSHTGTMTIENGFVTMDTWICSGLCVRKNKPRELLSLEDNNKAVILKDDDEFLGTTGTIKFSILSLSPNIILMSTGQDGTINVTEWKLRE